MSTMLETAIGIADRLAPNGQAGESTDYCKGWRGCLDYLRGILVAETCAKTPEAGNAALRRNADRYLKLRDDTTLRMDVIGHDGEGRLNGADLDWAVDTNLGATGVDDNGN